MEENTNPFDSRIDLTELRDAIHQIRGEIGKVIVGQTQLVDLLITAILADGHVLIEGVPGVAKTLTAKLIATTIKAGFSRIQFTPDLMPSDVLGTSVFNLKTSEFEFKEGPVFSNIILIDEINRAPAKTQAALFEVMEERQVTVDGVSRKMEAPFMVIATQNPIEQEGTYRLPEAQLDRFLFKIEVKYPAYNEEVEILKGVHSRKNVKETTLLTAVLSPEKIEAYRRQAREVVVEDNLIEYIAKIVENTRNNSALYLGGSPRASISMLNSSKAYAVLQGRDFITPDDVKFVTFPVLRHRLMLTAEKEMEGATIEEVVKQIIEAVEVPR